MSVGFCDGDDSGLHSQDCGYGRTRLLTLSGTLKDMLVENPRPTLVGNSKLLQAQRSSETHTRPQLPFPFVQMVSMIGIGFRGILPLDQFFCVPESSRIPHRGDPGGSSTRPSSSSNYQGLGRCRNRGVLGTRLLFLLFGIGVAKGKFQRVGWVGCDARRSDCLDWIRGKLVMVLGVRFDVKLGEMWTLVVEDRWVDGWRPISSMPSLDRYENRAKQVRFGDVKEAGTKLSRFQRTASTFRSRDYQAKRIIFPQRSNCSKSIPSRIS